MLRGIYTAASGMLAGQRRLDVIANNLANASTVGFKRDTAIVRSFANVLVTRLHDPGETDGPRPSVGWLGLGSAVAYTAAKLTDGAMRPTGNPLDVAISGDGFFAVDTPQGIRYTRQGNFHQDAQGRLVTEEGYAVLVDGRPAEPAEGIIAISDTGEVTVGTAALGQLTVLPSSELGAINKEGNGLWAPVTDDRPGTLLEAADPTGAYSLRVGYLEGSNVEAVTEMVEMLSTMRSYEASQKVLLALDETLQKATTEVGRV